MLEAHLHGVVLSVRAQPGARRTCIVGEHGGMLKVAVTQAAEKSKANAAVLDVLCDALDLRRGQVQLLSGETSRAKRVLVTDVTCDDLTNRLAALLG